MHVLTITHEVWEEDGVEYEEWDYHVDHDDDCELKPVWGSPYCEILDCFCPVGEEISQVGLDSLSWTQVDFTNRNSKLQAWEQQWHSLAPGRYEIKYWGETYMGEWEGGLRIVRRLTDES